MSNRRHQLAVIALILTTAGCGSGAASAGAPGASSVTASQAAAGGGGGNGGAAVDACTLLTPDEIKTATGLAVTGKGEPALKDGKECKWELEPGKNTEGVAFDRFVDVSVFGRSYFQGATAVSPGPESVSGVADQAVYVSDVLVALKGERSFALTVNLHEAGNGTPDISAKEHDAALALGKQAGPRF